MALGERVWRPGRKSVARTSDSTLWFRERDDLESLLAGHGFRVLDVRDAPDRPGREYVFIAQRTT